MKILTLNFLTCAVKTCKMSTNSFPLHAKDAELVHDDIEINPRLLVNVLPRLDWAALKSTSTEVSHVHFFYRVSCVFVLDSYRNHPSDG